jgi:plasmid stabilization system protein ParE
VPLMPRQALSRDARRDLLAIAAYISKDNGSDRLGDAFLDAVFATCETLVAHPEMGQLSAEFAALIDLHTSPCGDICVAVKEIGGVVLLLEGKQPCVILSEH